MGERHEERVVGSLDVVEGIESYPTPRGDAVARYYQVKYGIPTDCFLPGNGSTEMIYLLPRALGLKTTAAVGNGANDARMLKEVALGIAVVQEEGAAVAAIQNADVAFQSINDALDALLSPDRLVATLRI